MGQRGQQLCLAQLPQDAPKYIFDKKNAQKLRLISLFFAQNPAREAYSGHLGVRNKPKEGCPLQNKFLVTPMIRETRRLV